MRVGSWNIGTLTRKTVELAKILEKRRINIACVQETRWLGDKARDVDRFKLWYSRKVGAGTGAYTSQAGLDEEVKRRFWEDLDEMVRGIPHTEKIFIGGDFNGHIGATSRGYDDVNGGFGFGDRNEGGTSLLDFARSFDMVIENSSFPKKGEHLVTFRSSVAETQIDYLLCMKSNRCLCTNCKVIPSENLSTLHRLLVMDLEITRKRRGRAMYSQHRIKWGALMEAKAQELGVKLLTMGVWRRSRDASAMWTSTAQCIREAAREVLGVSKGNSSGHKGD
uniref:Craniofacial development protein 2-like n=2 Tax=Nicotiana TaxID=4085 RepID=A0A1S3YJM1_TOBAC|nr:PREDICTED: craniofacial development protein 2-like [Nicotiana sylvestris]XP_016452434.1 PREDICTED: craniofacial development protein 2-like [Nicotiana tabacum]